MMVGFCTGLEETFADIPVLTELGEGGKRVCVRIGYQDDTYLVAPASFLARTWDELGRGLEKGGHRLRASKCSAWAPSCAHLDPDDYPNCLKDLSKHIVITTNGIKILGGSAGGDLELEITADAVGLAPARKRADRALLLAARIEQFVTASPTPQAAQQSWFLLSKCCAHALSFDSRLVPSLAPPAVEEPVLAAVTRAVSSILTVVPGTSAQRRLPLAGCFGGWFAERNRGRVLRRGELRRMGVQRTSCPTHLVLVF